MANIRSKAAPTGGPASGDYLYLVDVSDTTDNAQGSDRADTIQNIVQSVDPKTHTHDTIANVATNTILGRVTTGSGNSEELTAAQVRTLINVEDGADVTDATNVDAAGAVMNSDTSTAGMSFVVDEDDMSSDSATKVPTQQSVKKYVDDNAGGTAAPRFMLVHSMETNTLGGSTQGRIEAASNGTSASTAYSTATGLQLVGASASGTTGYAVTYLTKQRNGQYIESKILDKNPRFYARIYVYSNTGGKAEFGLGMGSATADTAFTGSSNKTLCFRLLRTTAGGLVVYTVTGTGSAETATDVTTAATATTGWNTAGTNYDQLYVIDYTSGTSAKFYINGTLVATHTTNLPTGALTSANNILGAKIHNNADTSASSQIGVYSMYADFDAI